MRKNFKRNGILAFTLTAACAVTAGVALALPNATASAATATETKFEMVEKASVRVTDPAGMRFMVRVDETTMSTMQSADKAGFLIFPKGYLTESVLENGTYHDKYSETNTDYTGLYDYLDVEIGDNTYYKEKNEATEEETGYYLANGVVHTVKENNRELEYAAIAYYQSGESYTYASFDSEFSRSLSYVLQKAYITDAEDRAKIQAVSAFDWVGSESYPFEIATAEEYGELVASVSETNTYADKYVSITETITLANGFAKLPSSFAGTMSTATDKKLLFDAQNSTYVSFAEDEYAEAVAGVDYDCQNAKIPELSKDLFTVFTGKTGTTSGLDSWQLVDKGEGWTDTYDQTLSDGEYTGSKALCGKPTGGSVIRVYLNAKLDNYDLSNYSYITVWFAYSKLASVGTGEYTSASNTVNGEKKSFTVEESGQWMKFQISIDQLLTNYEAMTSYEGQSAAMLFRFGSYSSKDSFSVDGTTKRQYPNFFIGDIQFG